MESFRFLRLMKILLISFCQVVAVFNDCKLLGDLEGYPSSKICSGGTSLGRSVLIDMYDTNDVGLSTCSCKALVYTPSGATSMSISNFQNLGPSPGCRSYVEIQRMTGEKIIGQCNIFAGSLTVTDGDVITVNLIRESRSDSRYCLSLTLENLSSKINTTCSNDIATTPQPTTSTTSTTTTPQPTTSTTSTTTTPQPTTSTTPITTTSQPNTPDPTTLKPTTHKATITQPTTPQPTTPLPPTHKFNTSHATSFQITTQQPTTPQPSTPQLTSPLSTTRKPTIPQPTTPQSTTPQPTTPQPTIPQSTTRKPNTPQPTTPQPTTPQPTIPQSTTRKPNTPQPTTPQPTTTQPNTPQPTTPQPTTPKPNTPQSTTPQPTTPQPTIPQSTTRKPNTPQPTTPQPTTTQPTTPKPITPLPTTPKSPHSSTPLPTTYQPTTPRTTSKPTTPQPTTLRPTTPQPTTPKPTSVRLVSSTLHASSPFPTSGTTKRGDNEKRMATHQDNLNIIIPTVVGVFALFVFLVVVAMYCKRKKPTSDFRLQAAKSYSNSEYSRFTNPKFIFSHSGQNLGDEGMKENILYDYPLSVDPPTDQTCSKSAKPFSAKVDLVSNTCENPLFEDTTGSEMGTSEDNSSVVSADKDATGDSYLSKGADTDAAEPPIYAKVNKPRNNAMVFIQI